MGDMVGPKFELTGLHNKGKRYTMDTNQDPMPAEQWEEQSNGGGTTTQEVSGDGGSLDGDPQADENSVDFQQEIGLLRAVISGKSKWSKYLDSSTNFADVSESLRIIYKYSPNNKGDNPNFPKARLGDIEIMREDLLRLSSLNCYLAAQAAMYESNADNIEQERKLQRSISWTNIRKDIRNGVITEKMTQGDIKHTAEVDCVDLYRLEYELRQLGRMYSWVRAAVRTFTENLAVLIQSSMREERGDARLH